MKHLHITHARIISADKPAYGVTLSIHIPSGKLNETRRYIKARFDAERINLTYNEYEPVR